MRSQSERMGDLIDRLLTTYRECEWVEFKHNNADPNEMGEYISALANSAALHGRDDGYLAWGVRNEDLAPVGTTVDPPRAKVSAEELRHWLTKMLAPQVDFEFTDVQRDGHRLVVLRIAAASHVPVRFKNEVYIRVGSYKKPLAKHPDYERRLWRALDSSAFESRLVVDDLDQSGALALLDYAAYFTMLGLDLPEGRALIVEQLEADDLLRRETNGRWAVTALGAMLFAKDLRIFPAVRRKPLRIVVYEGQSRVSTLQEHEVAQGYAAAFQASIQWILDRVPTNEVIESALRRTVPMYPPVAVRELVANALIHQDFSIGGTGPMVEIFADRIEITNPGHPVVDPRRFLDLPPKSRNEALAGLMRRLGVCEERGSGWDKVATLIELHQLPAPQVEVTDDHTRVTLLGHRKLTRMDRDDRIRAVYLHACLRYVTRERMTNASVRERFGIAPGSSAQASRLIAEAVEEGSVVPFDPQVGKRFMSYVPFWAAPASAI